jgi:uncharacterized membrane protein YhaH (DUF805 family)
MTMPVQVHSHPHGSKRLEAFTSMGLAVGLTIFAGIYFFKFGGYEPTSQFWYYALAWIVLGYLAFQLIALLSTAIDTTSIGFGDIVCAGLPTIVGVVVLFEAAQKLLALSTFSENALLLMIGTSGLEFLITLWVRFTVNRKTTVFDTNT